jgi:hypothetical protein
MAATSGCISPAFELTNLNRADRMADRIVNWLIAAAALGLLATTALYW